MNEIKNRTYSRAAYDCVVDFLTEVNFNFINER